MKLYCQACTKNVKRLICYEDSRLNCELKLCTGCYNSITEGLLDITKSQKWSQNSTVTKGKYLSSNEKEESVKQ